MDPPVPLVRQTHSQVRTYPDCPLTDGSVRASTIIDFVCSTSDFGAGKPRLTATLPTGASEGERYASPLPRHTTWYSPLSKLRLLRRMGHPSRLPRPSARQLIPRCPHHRPPCRPPPHHCPLPRLRHRVQSLGARFKRLRPDSELLVGCVRIPRQRGVRSPAL